MKEFACRKCGSPMLFIKDNGTQIGLYCSDCGSWQKWLGKDEQRLAEQWIEHMNGAKDKQCTTEKESLKMMDDINELKHDSETIDRIEELFNSLRSYYDKSEDDFSDALGGLSMTIHHKLKIHQRSLK